MAGRISYSRKLLIPILALFTLIMTGGCLISSAESELCILSAAGAKPALDEICQRFEKEYGISVKINYGGGGETLSRMILARKGDVYIAPEQRFMEQAQVKQAIYPETINTVAYMFPVIGVKKGNPKQIVTLADLARPGIQIAITRPETTLLGKYAPEIFEKSGLGDAIEKNIATHTSDPNSMFTMLVMGQVDAGIIWNFYGTLAPDEIETIELSPEQLTGVGEMQIAISTYCSDVKSAEQFIDWVMSAESKAVLEKHGYIIDAKEVKELWK